MAISHGFNKTEAATSVTAPVTVNSGLQIVVGTAPVNMLDDPEAAVNTPLLVNTFKEAAAAVGYSSDFAKYTLCEAVSASFQVMGISPSSWSTSWILQMQSISPNCPTRLCR